MTLTAKGGLWTISAKLVLCVSRCPFVPGQKCFPVPLSLCSRTKKFCLSRCLFVPAVAKIPGQSLLYRDVPGQNQGKKSQKNLNFFFLNCNFFIFFFLLSPWNPFWNPFGTSFGTPLEPLLEQADDDHKYLVIVVNTFIAISNNQKKKIRKKYPFFNSFSFISVPGRDSLSKSWPVPSCGKILSLSRCPGTMKELLSRCPFVPGQKSFACPEKLHCPVQLETLSHMSTYEKQDCCCWRCLNLRKTIPG